MTERNNGRSDKSEGKPASAANQIASMVDTNKSIIGREEASIARIVHKERVDPMGEAEANKAWKNFVDNMNA